MALAHFGEQLKWNFMINNFREQQQEEQHKETDIFARS